MFYVVLVEEPMNRLSALWYVDSRFDQFAKDATLLQFEGNVMAAVRNGEYVSLGSARAGDEIGM